MLDLIQRLSNMQSFGWRYQDIPNMDVWSVLIKKYIIVTATEFCDCSASFSPELAELDLGLDLGNTKSLQFLAEPKVGVLLHLARQGTNLEDSLESSFQEFNQTAHRLQRLRLYAAGFFFGSRFLVVSRA